ncbi:MAG: tetratricopeptide repeat protein [Roseiflexaceae bacterium]|nr:tetratricopeptide repeat protein [Roseiflexaceae bacterium]
MAAAESAATVTPVRMLALIAAPLVSRRGNDLVPITLLPAQEELETLADTCRRLDVALEIQAEIATAERIGHVFATGRLPFDLLHFTGHGSQELDGSSVLALEDEVGAVRPMDAAELRRLIGSHPCRLAFLSACHSAGLATALIDAGVPHVVVINAADAVLDLAARAFAERFYAALLAGRTVAQAFEAGRTAVASHDELRAWRDPQTLQPYNLREELKFRLLPEGDPVHQQPLIPAPPRGAVTFRRPPWDRTNLSPVSADPFVGRARELHEIARHLRTNRCVAIHGMGGMGKTALALAAARWQRERDRWSDGVWLVTLRNIASAHEARNQIALALNLDPKAAESDTALAAALRDRHSLIVLDDLDALLTHDRSGAAALLTALLGARRLTLITTARRDLPGRVHHQPIELTRLDLHDAQIAFTTYAPPVDAWGEWTPDDWFNLHRFLDGYPFPIRLAATAMRQARLGLRELIRRLRENPQGTFRYPGDEEDRETSLAATLDLSYELLPGDAQQAFAWLALFPAGLTRDAVRAILGAASETALETLVQHSMAEWRDDGGYRRFALPEPARRYAEARQPPDALATYAPLALAFFADLIDAADDAITGGRIVEGRMVLTLEQPNIERFLAWGYDHEAGSGGISRAAHATARLGNYWTLTGEQGRPEIEQRLRRALTAAQRAGDQPGEANVRKAIGDVQQFRKETTAALASYEQALRLYRDVGDRLGEANVRKAIGDVQQFRKETTAALASYEQALRLYRDVGDRLGEANVLQAIGDVQQFRKETTAALASYEQALRLYRDVGAQARRSQCAEGDRRRAAVPQGNDRRAGEL